MKKKRKEPKGVSLSPLSLEDALRGAMQVDPRKVKGNPKKKSRGK
jgi:hypothetical protein